MKKSITAIGAGVILIGSATAAAVGTGTANARLVPAQVVYAAGAPGADLPVIGGPCRGSISYGMFLNTRDKEAVTFTFNGSRLPANCRANVAVYLTGAPMKVVPVKRGKRQVVTIKSATVAGNMYTSVRFNGARGTTIWTSERLFRTLRTSPQQR